MKYLVCFIAASLILMSCEKGVTFDLEESAPKLVVEATIETNQPPLVVLSKSQNFFFAFVKLPLYGYCFGVYYSPVSHHQEVDIIFFTVN